MWMIWVWYMVLIVYSIRPWGRPMGFLPIWFGHLLPITICLLVVLLIPSLCFCSKRSSAGGVKWYFRCPFFFPFQSMESIAMCIMHDFQQPSVIGALCIYCLSESLPRTGSKILWRDFQLGKCKATWCSKSFKTLHPWTASAAPHCRISQSFPRCAEWVVSFLSQLQRIDTSAEKCLFAIAVFSLIICETEKQIE